MKDIAGLTVTQYRIFARDVVPLLQLSTRAVTDALKERFSFKDFGADPDTVELVFRGGAVALRENEAPLWISQLNIGERRVAVRAVGTSAQANLIFAAVAEAIQVFTGTRLAEPMAFVEDTACAVTLDLEWQEFLAPDLRKVVLNSVVPASRSDDAEPFLKHVSLRFQIGYRSSERYRENGIIASDKLFTIEPRVDTPLGEHRYFTSSPVGSDKHLSLLQEFEASVGKRKRKPPVKT